MSSTAECLRSYGSQANGSELARFAKVRPATVVEWLTGSQEPKGDTLLSARVFLADHGYSVSEFEAIPAPARDLARLVAYGIVSVEEVLTTLGYTDKGSLFRLVLKGAGLPREREYRLNRLLESNRDALKQAMEEYRDDSAVPQPIAVVPAPPPVASRLSLDPVPRPQAPLPSVLPVRREPEPEPELVRERPPVSRKRERGRRSARPVGNRRYKTVAHLLFALDELLLDEDLAEVAAEIRNQISPRRTWTIRRLTDELLER